MSDELGLEKISFELRQQAWDTMLSEEQDRQEVFLALIGNQSMGGVSGPNEARRLFWACQLGAGQFWAKEQPSVLAEQLSTEIQTIFQNQARPISRATNEEEQVIQTLHYYFPTDQQLSNFEAALMGKLDDMSAEPSTPAQTPESSLNLQRYAAVFEESDTQSTGSVPEEQRPLIREYLANRQKGQLSAQIQKLVDEFYNQQERTFE